MINSANYAAYDCRFSTVVVRLLRKLKVLSSILRAGTDFGSLEEPDPLVCMPCCSMPDAFNDQTARLK